MDNMNKETLDMLEKIYQRQHYFIDRHDSMAEKFMNVLLVEATCFAFIFTIGLNKSTDSNLSGFQILFLSLFVLSFSISLCMLFFIVRPLSTKAKKQKDETLVKAENKKRISTSSIYYQGIVAQINKAKEDEKVPSEEYLSHLNEKDIGSDYLQQIFILAQYNVYKKEKLENALLMIIVTTFCGVIVALSLIIDFQSLFYLAIRTVTGK